jgi:hypothetical protein
MDDDAADLLVQVADRERLPVKVLEQLMALEPEFPDFNLYGAKTEFGRRVAAILDAAAIDEPAR